MKGKLKLIFDQTLMISTGILFLLGVEGVVSHFTGGEFDLYWYHPISIVLTGFCCSFPTLIFGEDFLGGRLFWLRVVFHCLIEWGIVSLAGWIFHWYSNGQGYLIVMIFYFLIYGFVWLASIWMQKIDEEKINQALQDIQDEE